MKLILLFSSLLATSCFLGATSHPDPERTSRAATAGVIAATDPIPPAKSGFTITVDRGPAPVLEQVVAEYQRATGVHLVTTPDVAAQLSKMSCGLSQTLEIPADRVHSTVERLLVQNGFLLTLLQAELPLLMGVERAENPLVRSRALAIPVADIDTAAGHPALLVSTVVTLPNINVSDISKSMRQIIVDPNIQQVVPMGRGGSLMIVGRGSDVASLVRTLQEVDEIEGQAQEAKRREAERQAPK